jgi:hypothetical protein
MTVGAEQTQSAAFRKADIDAYLTGLFAKISAAQLPDLPSILISGAVRCGKTKVARRVSLRGGYYHLRTDDIRNQTYLDAPEAEKRRVAKYVFRRILLRFPKGVLIEGTGLMDAPCELPVWADRRGIAFFAIGYAFDTPEAKQRDLLAYRAENTCWTKQSKSDEEMLRFARRLIRRSNDIKRYCAAEGLAYFDLDSARFDAERARIVREIERMVKTRYMEQARTGKLSGLIARLKLWS